MNVVLQAYLIARERAPQRGPIPYPIRDLLEALWEELTTPIYEIWLPYPQADGTLRVEQGGAMCREIPDYTVWLVKDEIQGIEVNNRAQAQEWFLQPQGVSHD